MLLVAHTRNTFQAKNVVGGLHRNIFRVKILLVAYNRNISQIKCCWSPWPDFCGEGECCCWPAVETYRDPVGGLYQERLWWLSMEICGRGKQKFGLCRLPHQLWSWYLVGAAEYTAADWTSLSWISQSALLRTAMSDRTKPPGHKSFRCSPTCVSSADRQMLLSIQQGAQDTPRFVKWLQNDFKWLQN